jgi:hypothetical protein
MKIIKSPQIVGAKRANKIYQRTNSIKTMPKRKFDASLLLSPLTYYHTLLGKATFHSPSGNCYQ